MSFCVSNLLFWLWVVDIDKIFFIKDLNVMTSMQIQIKPSLQNNYEPSLGSWIQQQTKWIWKWLVEPIQHNWLDYI